MFDNPLPVRLDGDLFTELRTTKEIVTTKDVDAESTDLHSNGVYCRQINKDFRKMKFRIIHQGASVENPISVNHARV